MATYTVIYSNIFGSIIPSFYYRKCLAKILKNSRNALDKYYKISKTNKKEVENI